MGDSRFNHPKPRQAKMSMVSPVLALLGFFLILVGTKTLIDRQKSGSPNSQGAANIAVPGICLAAGIGLLAFAIWNFASPVF
jgi:hypothetical protein